MISTLRFTLEKWKREQGAEIFISQNINYNYVYMISTLRFILENGKRAGSREQGYLY